MARINDKLLVAIAVAVTALICVAGMNFMLDSSGKDQSVHIAVSEDIKDEVTSMFADFETYTNSKLQISVPDDFSFNGKVDVIMTSWAIPADDMATDRLSADDIEERVMVTPEGTLIYVFFDKSKGDGIAGALMNWAFSLKEEIFVAVSSDIEDMAEALFRELEKSTNVKILKVPAGAQSFADGADMVMTTRTDVTAESLATAEFPVDAIGEKKIVLPDGTLVTVFYIKDAQTVADYLIDSLSEEQNIYVTIAANMYARMKPLFDAFEKYVKVKVNVTQTAAPVLAFSGNVNVIMSASMPASASISKIWVTTPDGPVYIYYPAGADGMTKVFIDWLSAQKKNIYVTVPNGLGTYIGTLLAGFDADTGAGAQVRTSASLSFGANANVIMTADRAAAAALAGAGVTEKAYIAQDGAVVYVLFRNDTKEITDLLTDWLFSKKVNLNVTVHAPLKARMMPFFTAFAEYTNANIVVTEISGSPPGLTFGTATDMIVTVNTPNIPAGVDRISKVTAEGRTYVYYKDGAGGAAGYFIEWLSGDKDVFFVTLSPGTEDIMMPFIDGLGEPVRVTVSDDLSFAGADMIMTADRGAAAGLMAPDIEEAIFFTPVGIPVSILFPAGTDIPLADGLLDRKVDLNVTIHAPLKARMMPFFTAFAGYTNANIVVTEISGTPPGLAFGAGVDITITVNVPNMPAGVDRVSITTAEGRTYVYFTEGCIGITEFFIEWLSGDEDGMFVTVSPGTEEMMMPFFDAFSHAPVRVSVRSSLSFAGGTDMIMSLVRAEASSLVGGSVTAADIEEKAFMASDGTVVYIFSLRDDAYGDAMIEMLFEQRHEVHITMADSKAGGMAPFIEAFVEYTNASVITYPVSGNPPVSFGGNVTIFVTVPGAAAPYEHIDMMTSEGRATVYFADGIAGMPKFFAEWLPASEDLGKVRVGVADGEESYIGSLLDGFGNVTVQALSPLSFAGDVNVITSFAHIPKASLAGGDVTAEGIVEKAYVASDKTIVYIYMRGDAHETTDPLTDWLFSQKVQLHILQSKNREAEAKPVLNAFAGYANVELVITLWTTGHAPLNFTGGTEIIINDTDTLPPGVSVAQMVPSAYAYYENNPDGMVKLFVDWLSYRAG